MKNFIHYEKRLRPYEIVGNERTPHLPLESDEIIIRTITKERDDNTRLLLLNNNQLNVIKSYCIRKVSDGFSYEYNIGSFSYNSDIVYSFENSIASSSKYKFSIYKESLLTSENTKIKANGNSCDLSFSVGENVCQTISISFEDGMLVFGTKKDSASTEIVENDKTTIRDIKSGYYAVLGSNLSISIYTSDDRCLISNLRIYVTHNENELIKISYKYDSECDGVFGTGERFNTVNQKGRKVDNMIFEQFTNQGKSTYFPIPFFFTTNGYGVLNNTKTVIEYDFDSTGDGYSISIFVNSKKTIDDTYFIFGDPSEVMSQYIDLSGKPALPPEWSFGLWISANRWNCQKHIEEQMEYIKKYNYPATAMVIEAWSDENTFYIFNEAKYSIKADGSSFSYNDFSFDKDGLWPNPKEVISQLKEMGIHTILWQIPVLKAIEDRKECLQHNADTSHATKNNLCVMDGKKAYKIPDFWFSKSYLPDFTNPEARRWWFSKRQYLLDIGVDGFKTDGGEFIYKDDLSFYSGDTGIEMKNQYSCEYIKSYSEFVGSDKVLFSRASYLGNQKNPIHWAGDQMSTWEEFCSVVKAGLSLGLSGVPFWSFDIAGFAGDLPSDELYIRATQLAVFAPVMQWHSEPMTGQFQEVYKRDGATINDRSPWNIAEVTGNPEVIYESIRLANLRLNLLPYIYSQANISANTGRPMMKHLVYDNPHDVNTYSVEDQFMLGDILVAPILHEGRVSRDVYLPEGEWLNLNTGDIVFGGRLITDHCGMAGIPLYLKSGSGVAFNLNEQYAFYESVPKSLNHADMLSIVICGKKGEYKHIDKSDEILVLRWDENNYEIVKNTSGKTITLLSHVKFKSINSTDKIKFNEVGLNVYKN